jgi:hypothetical protein
MNDDIKALLFVVSLAGGIFVGRVLWNAVFEK